MIDTQHVFVADAKPALAQAALRSAYVFGANTPLGEILLTQVLANPAYNAIYIATLGALPSTVVHLQHFLASAPFAWQDAASHIDCFFVVQPAPSSNRISRSGVPQHITSRRNTIYAPLYDTAVPTLLRQIAGLEMTANTASTTQAITLRWLVIAPESEPAVLNAWLLSHTPHIAALSYSGDGDNKAMTSAYRFQAQGNRNSFLDQLAVLLLNTLSNAAHGMLNGKHKTPLSMSKLIQRVLTQFSALQPQQPLTHLTREDVLSALKPMNQSTL
jgi:hypothetical protein